MHWDGTLNVKENAPSFHLGLLCPFVEAGN